jgi:hypothetical protein
VNPSDNNNGGLPSGNPTPFGNTLAPATAPPAPPTPAPAFHPATSLVAQPQT